MTCTSAYFQYSDEGRSTSDFRHSGGARPTSESVEFAEVRMAVQNSQRCEDRRSCRKVIMQLLAARDPHIMFPLMFPLPLSLYRLFACERLYTLNRDSQLSRDPRLPCGVEYGCRASCKRCPHAWAFTSRPFLSNLLLVEVFSVECR